MAAARILGELLGEIRQHLRRDLGAQRVEILVRVRRLDVAQQVLELVVVRFVNRKCGGSGRSPANHPAKAAEGMAGRGMRRRIRWSRCVTTLPPDEQQSGDNHNQCDLQHQADDGGEAGHAAKKSVSKQEPEQACTDEAGGKAAEQAAAKQPGACRRRLANRIGFPWLGERALHGRGGVRRGLRRGRRGESASPSTTARGSPTSAGMRVRGNEQARDYRSNRDCKTASDHVALPANAAQRICIGTSICKGPARATKSRRIRGQLSQQYHTSRRERAGRGAYFLVTSKEARA